MDRRYFASLALLTVSAVFIKPSLAATSTASFVETATVAGMFEIQSSNVALTKAQFAEVRAFAERMINDHTKVANELESLTKGKYETPAVLDAKHKAMIQDLEGTDMDFDRLYASLQTQAHEEAVALFAQYAKTGDDASIREFAVNTLPVLDEHLIMIKMIDQKMGS